MIPQRDKTTNIDSDIARGKKLKKKIERWSDEVATKLVNDSMDMNETIATIARNEGLTEAMIQRVVEESNILAYQKYYSQHKGSNDRRFTYPLASLSKIRNEMGEDAPERMLNPNIAEGKGDTGEMKKTASENIESSYVHSPHRQVRATYDKHQSKVAKDKETAQAMEKKATEKEQDEAAYKVAHTLVQSERSYKNSNELFNTLASDVSLNDDTMQLIEKKASSIINLLKEKNKVKDDFVLHLKKDATVRVSDPMLGEYSLMKQANETPKNNIKVKHGLGVYSYNDLVKTAGLLADTE